VASSTLHEGAPRYATLTLKPPPLLSTRGGRGERRRGLQSKLASAEGAVSAVLACRWSLRFELGAQLAGRPDRQAWASVAQ
jgi:hypothetical protein